MNREQTEEESDFRVAMQLSWVVGVCCSTCCDSEGTDARLSWEDIEEIEGREARLGWEDIEEEDEGSEWRW